MAVILPPYNHDPLRPERIATALWRRRCQLAGPQEAAFRAAARAWMQALTGSSMADPDAFKEGLIKAG
jgi:hypothetical protein